MLTCGVLYGLILYNTTQKERLSPWLKPGGCSALSLTELTSFVEEGCFPIVYVDMWPLRGGISGQNHAFVVITVDPETVTVLDPLIGERTIPQEDFQVAWAAMRYLTIVINTYTKSRGLDFNLLRVTPEPEYRSGDVARSAAQSSRHPTESRH